MRERQPRLTCSFSHFHNIPIFSLPYSHILTLHSTYGTGFVLKLAAFVSDTLRQPESGRWRMMLGSSAAAKDQPVSPQPSPYPCGEAKSTTPLRGCDNNLFNATYSTGSPFQLIRGRNHIPAFCGTDEYSRSGTSRGCSLDPCSRRKMPRQGLPDPWRIISFTWFQPALS